MQDTSAGDPGFVAKWWKLQEAMKVWTRPRAGSFADRPGIGVRLRSAAEAPIPVSWSGAVLVCFEEANGSCEWSQAPVEDNQSPSPLTRPG